MTDDTKPDTLWKWTDDWELKEVPAVAVLQLDEDGCTVFYNTHFATRAEAVQKMRAAAAANLERLAAALDQANEACGRAAIAYRKACDAHAEGLDP